MLHEFTFVGMVLHDVTTNYILLQFLALSCDCIMLQLYYIDYIILYCIVLLYYIKTYYIVGLYIIVYYAILYYKTFFAWYYVTVYKSIIYYIKHETNWHRALNSSQFSQSGVIRICNTNRNRSATSWQRGCCGEHVGFALGFSA